MPTSDEIPARVWARITKPHGEAGCWVWTGAKASGYGRVYWYGKVRPVHRVIYEALVAPVSAELDLDHRCRNRACANPAHLEPVTRQINLLRGRGLTAKNAAKDECANGHPYTPENTYVSKTGRHCRTCRAHVQKNRKRPPLRVIEATCVICETTFSYERGVGGSAINVCSEECRTARQRRAARDYQRRRRATVPATEPR